MSKRNKVLLGGGGLLAIVALVLASASAKREKGIEVRFEKVGQRDLVAAVTASGKVQPKKQVDVSADITGRITRLAVREGDFVRKGQFLLQIDPTIYQANLQRAQANLASAQAGLVQAQANREQAQRGLGRTKDLREQNPNLVSPEQLEQAQTAFNVAEAIANSSTHQVDQARAGVQEARDHPPTDIRPDLSATARVVTDTRKHALSIPIIALTVRENTPVSTENRRVDTTATGRKKETEGVFVVQNGRAVFRPVKVGIAGDEYFEVLDGLHTGETIVAGPYQAIRDLKENSAVRASRQAADSGRRRS